MGSRHASLASIASRHPRRITVGILIPLSGPAGVWGSSCHACAVLAAEELNAQGGLDGREIDLSIVDAGGDPDAIGTATE
jgi:ABC-type branched-subunit amino acid transport system substrate-binding protein